MKTPTRILVGGPEVTSAFVLMALALARKAMMAVSEPGMERIVQWANARRKLETHGVR